MLHPFYYLLMFIMTIFSFIEFYENKKGNKKSYIIIVIILILVTGLRIDQGADYPIYLILFKVSNVYLTWGQLLSFNNLGVESSYYIIAKIVGALGLPFFGLLLIYAALSLYLKASTFWKFSPYPFFSLLFYFMPTFFFEDNGQFRQGIAISFCLFSCRYIVKKELFMYLLIILCAYFFHKTAIIFFPAYWIAQAKIPIKTWIIFIIISIICWPLKLYIYLDEFLNSFDDTSFGQGYNTYQHIGDLGFGPSEIVRFVFLIIMLVFDKVTLKKVPNYMKIRNVCFVYFCLFYFFHGNQIFAVRLPNAYSAYTILAYPMILYAIREKWLYWYIIFYLYLLSWRFWSNATALGFNNFRNIIITPYEKSKYDSEF